MAFKFNPITGKLDLVGGSGGGSGTGTANRFAGFDSSGNLESINNWQRNSYLGASVNQSPSLTDIGSTASAVLNQKATVITPTNDLTNTFIYQDLTTVDLGGALDYVAFTGHEFSATQTGASDIADLVLLFPRVNLGVGGGINTSSNVRVIDSRIRLSGGHAGGTVRGISSSVQLDAATSASEISGFLASVYSGGTLDYAYGINSLAQIAGGATLNQTLYGSSIGSQVDSGGSALNAVTQQLFHSGSLLGDYTGQSVLANNGTIGGNARVYSGAIDDAITGNLTLFDGSTSNTVGGDFIGYYLNDSTAVAGRKTFFSGNHSGSAVGDLLYFDVNGNGNTTGNFRAASLSNSGAVSQFGSGFSIYQGGDVTKGFNAFSANIGGNVGDGTGTSFFGVDLTTASGKTIDGGVYGLNLNNQADVTGQLFGVNIGNSAAYAGMSGFNLNNTGNMTGNNTLFGGVVSNTGTGYSLNGFSASNSGNMSEEIRGFSFNSSGDARTSTGLDLSMQGTITDDAQAIRVNLNGTVSTASNVKGVQIQMGNASGADPQGVVGLESDGRVQVNATTTLTPGLGFQIGSRIANLYQVPSGSPVTGTDSLGINLAGDLLAEDDVFNGGFGIGFNSCGFIASMVVADTKTVQSATAFLAAVTFPDPGTFTTGGTITDLTMIKMYAPLPQGGTAIVTNLYGVKIDPSFGPFGSAAANPWGVWVGDDSCNNWFAKNVVIGGATGLPTASDALDVTGSMVVSGNVGFFGVASQPQQVSSGAATAGALYTATEQTMLQEVYNAIRAYGLMT